MEKPTSFKLPQSFLSQLNEFTLGYLLITVNEAGEFETFVKADTPITRVGLIKFSELVSDTLANSLSQTVANPIPDGPPLSASESGEDDTESPFGPTMP